MTHAASRALGARIGEEPSQAGSMLRVVGRACTPSDISEKPPETAQQPCQGPRALAEPGRAPGIPAGIPASVPGQEAHREATWSQKEVNGVGRLRVLPRSLSAPATAELADRLDFA